MRKNNELIKRVLNLKEDYKLNLDEGQDDEDLTVLQEDFGITEDEYKHLVKGDIVTLVLPDAAKEFKSVKFSTYLYDFAKKDCVTNPNKNILKSLEKNFKKGNYEYFAKYYSNKFEDFEKEFVSYLKKAPYKTAFAKAYKANMISNKNTLGKHNALPKPKVQDSDNEYAEKGLQIKVKDEYKVIDEEEGFWEVFVRSLNKLENYYNEEMGKVKKFFENKKEPKKEPEKEPEGNIEEQPKKLSKAEKEMAEKATKALQSVHIDEGYDPNIKGSFKPTFPKNFNAKDRTDRYTGEFNKNKNNPSKLFKLFRELLDEWKNLFSIDETNEARKAIIGTLQEPGEQITGLNDEELDNAVVTNNSEAPEIQESQAIQESEGGEETSTPEGSTEDSEANTSNNNVQSEVTFSQVDNSLLDALKDPRNVADNLDGKKLPEILSLLRLLAIADNFPYIGKYFQSCEELRVDAKDIYTYYLILMIDAHFQTVFKANSMQDGNAENNTGSLDEKTASRLLKQFYALVYNKEKNAYSGLLRSLVGDNDILGQTEGYLMMIRECLKTTLDTITIMTQTDVGIRDKGELIKWRKQDCVKAHKAFDEALKAELATCFKNVLEKEFSIEKDGQEIKQPIKDYMFDVQIPRRFKKVLNSKNEEFEDFIKQYYSKNIIEGKEKNSKVLVDYFDKVAESKEKSSLDYKSKEASDAIAAVKEDIEESAKEFIAKNDIKGDEAAELQRELENEEVSPEGNNEPRKPQGEGQPETQSTENSNTEVQSPEGQSGEGNSGN